MKRNNAGRTLFSLFCTKNIESTAVLPGMPATETDDTTLPQTLLFSFPPSHHLGRGWKYTSGTEGEGEREREISGRTSIRGEWVKAPFVQEKEFSLPNFAALLILVLHVYTRSQGVTRNDSSPKYTFWCFLSADFFFLFWTCKKDRGFAHARPIEKIT